MPKTGRELFKWHLDDLVATLLIVFKELVVSIAILGSGRVLVAVSGWWFPHGGWSTELVKTLSEVFAIFAFIVLAVRDIWRYLKGG
jgi:hypothetical protein